MVNDVMSQLTQAKGQEGLTPESASLEIQKVYKNIISKFLIPSPLKKSNWLSEYVGGEVYLKLESLNPNGSFKVRGALNAVSKLKERLKQQNSQDPIKIVAASAGNHAQGVAYACRELGCAAHIFLPKQASLIKRDATEKLGAKIYLVGDNIEEATQAALEFCAAQNAHFIHPFNNYDIIIGQGTCALETYSQLSDLKKTPTPQLDYFVTSIGGGGLMSGACLYFSSFPKIKMIGVEQELFNSAAVSLHAQKHIPAAHEKAKKATTIADGIAVKMIGNLNYEYMAPYIEKVTQVSDDHIVQAILGLCEKEHVVSEGAGAAGVAELLAHPKQYADKLTVVCVSGGNIDLGLLNRVITRGLKVTGRVLRLKVCVSDKPGGLRSLLDYVANMEGNILDLVHDRTYSSVAVGYVDVEISLETRGAGHQRDLIQKLEEVGFCPRVE